MSVAVGVDFGERRVGLAVSDPARTLAFARETVTIADSGESVEAVARLCEAEDAGVVVVGMPLNMDGSAGPMAATVTAFVDRLAKRVNLPVETWDERLSTALAERVLLEADVSRARRRRVRDKLAAQAILQAWLDAQG